MIVRFYMRSGTHIDVECDDCEVKASEYSNNLTHYSIEGIKGDTPIYIRIAQVDDVVKLKEKNNY